MDRDKPDRGTPIINFPLLHRQVVFGQTEDGGVNHRIIWQPRIGCWYTDKGWAGKPLPAPYTGMTIPEIYRALGCSNRLYDFNDCFRRIEHSGVYRTQRPIDEITTQTTSPTPVANQIAVHRKSSNTRYNIEVKWEVEPEEELKIAAWREENTTWEWDQARYDSLMETMGDLGAPTMYMPRMNVQSLYIEKMGIEEG